MNRTTRCVLAFCIVVATVFFAAPAAGQTVVTGHYQPMVVSGLKSGILPTRPGLIYQNGTFFYYTDSFKDNSGNEIGGGEEVNLWANRNSLIWISGQKLFGADYGAAVAVPIANLAPRPVIVAGETLDTGFGVGDIIVSPVVLGWHWTDFHLQGGYYAFLPTGKFDLGATDNVGKGFWTHMFALGGTWMPAEDLPWHVSLMTRYEIHSNQEDRDVTPGDTLTLEAGIGKSVSETVDVGVIGHLYRQITGTKGRDAVDPLKYRSYGVGLEVGCLLGGSVPTKTRLGFDFGARNLSEGRWAVLEFNFLF